MKGVVIIGAREPPSKLAFAVQNGTLVHPCPSGPQC